MGRAGEKNRSANVAQLLQMFLEDLNPDSIRSGA